jgi:hypothetical protein
VGGYGGGGEFAAAANEAAARLLIAISTFTNDCSTLAKTWLRFFCQCYSGPFADIPAILFLHAWQAETTGW